MNKKMALKRVGVAIVATTFLSGAYLVSTSTVVQASTVQANSNLKVDTLVAGAKTITGTGTPGHYLNVTNLSTKAVLATGNTLKVSSNGRFSLTLPANQTLKSGQQIAISDSADLKGSTAIYQVQGSAIYVNPLNSGDTVITGTGIPGHFLNITNLSTKTVLATGNTLKVSADGTFSLTLPSNQPLKSGQQLYISDSADLKGTTAIYTVNN